ncbi:helix-turn-helix domain-containing protein [Crenalkalicoccus roseus]|uniref:helix-turn-helix domain-containing protein n=1 Tax=Crenalkalicoccus roseus TaxID=1485588 RepID=UPI00108139D4|nr:helix-turn-helix transcriptional regulator [Crenalkalicoccus roseus]
MSSPARPVGELLREWRQRRRLSQLDLACEAGISQRHLSCLESGRARPSRGMLLRLAERLEVPLRERNLLLVAAGFAPAFAQRALGDAALRGAQEAVLRLLAAHEPWPALALDRHWSVVATNRAVPPLLAGCAPELLRPPVNALRLSLHPGGLAPRIRNLGEWRAHLLERLRRQVEATADAALIALLEELRRYPAPPAPAAAPPELPPAVPLRLATAEGTLALLSATTVFGTPLDVTLAELMLETFLPADAATAAALHRLAGEGQAA